MIYVGAIFLGWLIGIGIAFGIGFLIVKGFE